MKFLIDVRVFEHHVVIAECPDAQVAVVEGELFDGKTLVA
jgi:hypothetical protein